MDNRKHPRNGIKQPEVETVKISGDDAVTSDAFAKFDSVMALQVQAPPSISEGDGHFNRWAVHSPERLMIMVTGVKGGPGKSTMTMSLVDVLLSYGIRFLVCDADQKTRDVGPACKDEPNLRVIGLKLEARTGMQGLVTIMKETQISPVVVNFPAGLTSPFDEYGPPLRRALKEFGYQLVILYMLSPLHDSVNQLGVLLDQMPDATVHAVLNIKEGPTEQLSDFEYYLGHPVRKRVEAQGRTLLMPVGPRAAMNLMESQKRTYRRIANDPSTDFFDKTLLETFLDDMATQLERVFEFRRPI